METQEGYILQQKSLGKERLEDYSTFIALLNFCNRRTVVFQSFFTMTFLQQNSLLVFSSLPCLCTFFTPNPTCTTFYSEFFHTWYIKHLL